MPFIIDGHNLIGVLPDIQLADPDDEEQLLKRLQSITGHIRKTMHVYFDQRAPGAPSTFRQGRLIAHFVHQTSSADDAIKAHIRRLGKEASNWTVVSSDHAVLDYARNHGARTMTSQDFTVNLNTAHHENGGDDVRDVQLSPDEIRSWEELFDSGDSTST